eukprot:6070612-Amphidinium_carterae.1
MPFTPCSTATRTMDLAPKNKRGPRPNGALCTKPVCHGVACACWPLQNSMPRFLTSHAMEVPLRQASSMSRFSTPRMHSGVGFATLQTWPCDTCLYSSPSPRPF